MSDLIERQAVLDKFKALCEVCGKREKYNGVMCRCCALDDGICIVEDAPDAELEVFEFCASGENPCKEYDQERHCCHRWTKVIRQTVEKMKTDWKWILVTEALPEKKEMVLITNNKGHVRCGQYQGTFDDKNYRWWWKHNTLEEVLAWQPLPEPWRGE